MFTKTISNILHSNEINFQFVQPPTFLYHNSDFTFFFV